MEEIVMDLARKTVPASNIPKKTSKIYSLATASWEIFIRLSLQLPWSCLVSNAYLLHSLEWGDLLASKMLTGTGEKC